jgi:beta-galactosidase
VKVYSNCPTAELFVNGASAGARKRNSQDFPAAGLRWMVKFAPGKNHLRVVASKNGVTVSDEIEFEYQTAKWGKPARFRLAQIARDKDVVTIEATPSMPKACSVSTRKMSCAFPSPAADA